MMLATTTTCISFEVPKDSQLLNDFIDNVELEGWEESESGKWITYVKQETLNVTDIRSF